VARMREMRNAYVVSSVIMTERGCLEDTGSDGSAMLTHILKNWGGIECAELIWLRTGAGCGAL
jgi:hypothetical protein